VVAGGVAVVGLNAIVMHASGLVCVNCAHSRMAPTHAMPAKNKKWEGEKERPMWESVGRCFEKYAVFRGT
jgi:hypothetical protein